MYRIRITFSKYGKARWIGNLDLHRTWARILRRAEVPIAYSQGFNPQPRMQLASALPLGIVSICEILDIWVIEPISTDRLKNDLAISLPSGIDIIEIVEVDLKGKSLQSRLRAAEYVIELEDYTDIEVLQEIVDKLLAMKSIIRQRRGKDYDMRSLIQVLYIVSGDSIPQEMFVRFSACPGATGRPSELLEYMGITAKTINRTKLLFVDNDG
ncbi:MAG: TIGR03936 family radical SAM-associated protein [Chloroflexota bacterium]|nr:TIGR03936 family radical SAM-associated protein [Chloroflexota bacterium]